MPANLPKKLYLRPQMFTQSIHKIKHIILLLSLYNVVLYAQQDIIHISMFGEDSIKSDFFKKWYHQGDLVYYLEALNDHTIVENHTTGQWWLPDRLVIGVEGNSFFWNRYYIDGFRVDDRFQPGSTQYVPNMEQTNLWLNTHTSQFLFETFPIKDNYRFTYNWGGITRGNPAFLTEEIVHIFHRTCTESADTYHGAYAPVRGVEHRQHVYAWGQIPAAFLYALGATAHDQAGRTRLDFTRPILYGELLQGTGVRRNSYPIQRLG